MDALKPFKELGLILKELKRLPPSSYKCTLNFAAKLVHIRHALSSTVINSHQEPVSGQAMQPSWSPLNFPFLFTVEELYGTRYQSGSFSLIIVGSGFHCLHSFLFSSIVYLQRLRQQKHANSLQTILNHIQQYTHHLSISSRLQSLRNSACAETIEKALWKKQSGRDIHSNTNTDPHVSILWPARVLDPPPAHLPEDTCQPVPSTERLSIFS